jgi:UDP-GlcNAc:undecaprenyl-phosphate/decaprenyl-phosphate GlcNAc-1-phosphate transferase
MSDSLEILLVGVMAALVAFGLTPLAARLAGVLEMQDEPSDRKLHLLITPYLGGLAILAGWSIAFLTTRTLSQTFVLMAGMLVLGIMGFIDDRGDLSPWLRLGIQLTVAVIAWAGGVRMTPFDLAPVDSVLTVLWLVGITNAFNFMDNMDGLAAGVGGLGALSLGLTATFLGQKLVAILAFGLAGSCFGFLRYNLHPARIFMGDTGSMPLGFGLAVVAIKIEFPAIHPAIGWSVPVLALGLFILDTSVMTLGRLTRREPLIGGRKDHISHRLLNRGYEINGVLKVMYGAAIFYGISAILVSQLSTLQSTVLVGFVGAFSIVGFIQALRLPPLDIRRSEQEETTHRSASPTA